MSDSSDVKAFRAIVYLVVRQIPPGQVSTYGQIAGMIPPPIGIDPNTYRRVRAQWVGRAMRHAPEDVPWQRVINSQGRISLPAGSRGAALQRMRLEAEGILFDRQGRVDLGRFGWAGPAVSWVDDHGLMPARPLRATGFGQLDLFSHVDADDQ